MANAILSGVGQVLGRTILIQMNTANGIPIPLAVLDVVKDEDIEYDAEVTDHPVEAGPEVSDHIQLHNTVIRLKGSISNTPLDLSVAIANLAAGTLAAISSSQARANLLNAGISEGIGVVGAALQGNVGNAVADAEAAAIDAVSRVILINAWQQKTPFSILTKRQRYDNVVIKHLRFPRNDETGEALVFEMDIRQLTIVSPLKVQKTQLAENVISSGSSSTNIGSQSTQLVSPQAESAVQGSNLSSQPAAVAKSPEFFA